MKERIGLVLSGGGAKGAYQAGVLKALKEYKLLKRVKMISGTSIGSLNALKVMEGDIEGAIKIWKGMYKALALTSKSFLDKIKTRSLYSRDGFIKLANEEFDLKKISKSKIKCYVTVSPVDKENTKTEFLVNGENEDRIITYLLASSAIPVVFEPVEIDGEKYVDGGLVDNVPVSSLKNRGCNILFVVPLSGESDAYKYSDDKTLIIDFVNNTNETGFGKASLDFDSEACSKKLELGYQTAKALIEQLIKDKVIKIHWYTKLANKKRTDNYYKLGENHESR